MQSESWTYHNYRTTRIIYSLTQQVLTKTTLLTLDHICERFQRSFVRPSNRATTTTVIEKCIYRFLQHSLLITHNDVRRIKIEQTLQSVIPVYYTAVQVVQIRRRKSTAVQWHQRTQIRRKYRKHIQHHPLGLVARAGESFH